MATPIPAFPQFRQLTHPIERSRARTWQFALSVYRQGRFSFAVLSRGFSRGLRKITLALIEFVLSKISAPLEGPGSVSPQMAERFFAEGCPLQPMSLVGQVGSVCNSSTSG